MYVIPELEGPNFVLNFKRYTKHFTQLVIYSFNIFPIRLFTTTINCNFVLFMIRGFWLCSGYDQWLDFPGGSDGKASAYNAGDLGLIPGSERSPGEGNGNPLQYSCLENSMDGGTRWASQKVGHDWATSLSFFSFLWNVQLDVEQTWKCVNEKEANLGVVTISLSKSPFKVNM